MNRYYGYTVCKIFAPIFQIWITCYSSMRTINFGKYLRLFQIGQIKTVELRFSQIENIGEKVLHTVDFIFPMTFGEVTCRLSNNLIGSHLESLFISTYFIATILGQLITIYKLSVHTNSG